MIIDLTNIQQQQVDFINWLENKPGMINEKNKFGVTKKQSLALISELYEVENEVKYIHKWWDKTETDNNKVILELSDFLSHLANVTNYIGIDLISEVGVTQIDELEGQFLSLTRHLQELPYLKHKLHTKKKLEMVFIEFIQLVYSLGFSIDELEEAYKIKLKSNYENPKFQ